MKSVLTEKKVSIKTRIKSRVIPPDEFLTTRDLMRLLKIKHKQTIYRFIEAGLPAVIVGKSYRFIKVEVIGYLKQITKKEVKKRLSGGGECRKS